MWKIFRKTGAVKVAIAISTAVIALSSHSNALAQESTITQNQNGFSLPGVQLPSGHDEVRAADGTTCRSAISGNGAYIDVGIIGNPTDTDNDNMSGYGRLVIPLSQNRKRLDCTKLYDLEVARLQMELRLMQMGLSRGVTPPSGTGPGGEAEEIAAASSDAEVGTANESTAAKELEKTAQADSTGEDWDDEGWTTDGKS